MTKIDRDIRISTVGRDDYPELEGKIVKITNAMGEDEGIVVGCNRSLGCTIVKTDNKDQVLACFSGPVAPGGIKPDNMVDLLAELGKTYDDLFDYVVELIEKGEWKAGSFTNFLHQPGVYSHGTCNSEYCAYTQ